MSDLAYLDKLEAAARAATPGQWMRLFGERTVYDRMEDGCRGNAIVRADVGWSIQEAADLDFIAAANPDVVLGLIADLRAALQAQQGDQLDAARVHEVYLLAMVDPFISPVATKDRWLASLDRSIADRSAMAARREG
jgi:hypothetical protein